MSVAYHTELHKAHVERQRRLWGQKKQKPILRIVQYVEEPEAFAEPPEWVKAPIYFDEHVRVYQNLVIQAKEKIRLDDYVLEVFSPPKKPVRDIINETLEMFPGITMEMVKGKRRGRKVIEARHVCMYEIFTQRPDLSYPTIGRILGKDHTSVMFGVRKIQALKGDAAALRFIEQKNSNLNAWLDKVDPRRLVNRKKRRLENASDVM